MKLHRKIAVRRQPHTEFRRIVLLSVFCVLGILFGCIAVRYVSTAAVSQLTSYLDTYIKLRNTGADLSSFFISIIVYFRYILLLFLFSFSPVGVYFIPLVCLIQGFGLSFATTMFVRCVGKRILTLFSLFGLRCIFILPAMLCCGSAAILSASHGKESRDKEFWSRFCICTFALLIGAVLESFIVPNIFSAAYTA